MKRLINFKSPVNSVHERMIRAVVTFALDPANITITQRYPAFLNLVNDLHARLKIVDNLRAIISQPITGYAQQKKEFKLNLVQQGEVIIKAAYTYSIDSANPVLAASLVFSESEMQQMKYTDLVPYVQGVINQLTPIIANLANYGVFPADLNAWQFLCTQLAGAISNPKNAIANREALNKDLQTQLRFCMNTLWNQCDPLAMQCGAFNIDYYNSYLANRKLNPFTLHTQWRVHTVDDLQQPTANIPVEVVITNGTNLTGVTDANGYCLIEPIPFGNHNVIVNGRQYGPLRFKKGQSFTQHYTVAPLFAPQLATTTAKEPVNK